MTIRNSFPDVRPALNLDFANTKRLDPRITFTRSSTGTYVDEFGVIKTAASNEARFDHDTSGNSLGLLIEESRTNLLPYSVDFTNWTLFDTGDTVTSSALTAPDGTLTGTFYAPDSTNNAHAIRTPYTFQNATTYTLSVFVKEGGRRYIHLAVGGVTLGFPSYDYRRGVFDLQTGSVYSAPTNGSADVQTFANGWHRCRITITAATTDTANFDIYHANTTTPTSNSISDGNGTDGIYIWGAQLEQGSFPTSYIPTSGSTATRSADVASISNAFSTTAFTIINEPFGSASGSDTLQILGAGSTPIRKTSVYDRNLTQTQINAVASVTDEFWRWRVLGSSFALPSFTTDGQVTVDWGDGTVETLTTSEHTFSNGGGYHEIGFRLDSGTYFRPYINNNASHDTKVVALGPAPASMALHGERAFYGCSNLEVFDATVDATGGTSIILAWENCSSLTNFPLINTSNVTNFGSAWRNCSSLTSFPVIDTSSGTSFSNAWRECTNLASFPLLDTSNVTNLSSSWSRCTSLTSFPLIDTSSVTSFASTWSECSSLTSLPLLDTSSGTAFNYAWYKCSSLTSFPAFDLSNGTTFFRAWQLCTSLTYFPPNLFDSWTATPANNCFFTAWGNCNSLTATSVENILNSIDTSGQSAPASGVEIPINYDTGTGTPSVATAVSNLKSRGWDIYLNGVLQ